MAPTKNKASDSYANKEKSSQSSILSKISKSINKNIRDQLLFSILLETGCSVQELIELKPKDVEFTTSSIHLGKGEQKRKVTISSSLILQLNYFVNTKAEFVFSSRQSKQLTNRRVMQLTKYQSKNLLGNELNTREVKNIFRNELIVKAKDSDDAKKILGLKSIRTKEILNQEQIHKIKRQIKNSQHALIFDVLLETGCKLNELINIKINHINFANNEIKFENRVSKISGALSLQIKSFVKEKKLTQNQFLFSTRQNLQISDKRVFQIIRDYALLAGLNGIGPQILRNTTIAQAIDQGKTADEIRLQTGIKHLDLHHYGLKRNIK